MFKNEEFEEILSHYNLGQFISICSVFKDDSVSYGAQIITTKGEFFIKIFKARSGISEDKINLVKYLQDNGLPSPKLYDSKAGLTIIPYHEYKVAIFDLIKEDENLNLNKEEVFELAKGLSKLHSINKPAHINLGSNKYGIAYFKKHLKNYFTNKETAPDYLQEVIEFLYKFIIGFEISPAETKSLVHVEFTPEHTRFSQNKLTAVIDFDEMCFDYRVYDIANALISCFDNIELDYDKVNYFIKGYQENQHLTSWEIDNLFELLLFGSLINCTWNLTDPVTNELRINYDWPEVIERVQFLMKLTKKEFLAKLN